AGGAGEALEHHRLPARRPYLRWTVCLVTPRRPAISCQDQPSSRARWTCRSSSRSASPRSAATARSPTSGSLLAAPSAIWTVGSMSSAYADTRVLSTYADGGAAGARDAGFCGGGRTPPRSRPPPPRRNATRHAKCRCGITSADAALTVAELDHVAVLHDVVLALDACLPRGPRGGDRPGGDQVVVGHDLGLDEAPLEVAMDHPGRLGCRRPDADRPGPGFLWPGGQERGQPERGEPGLGQPVQSRLPEPEFCREFGRLAFGQLREFPLGLAVGEDGLGRRHWGGELFPLVLGQAGHVGVEHVQERFGR